MEEEAYLNSLPSGFRFKPTDVELVDYYLKRKVYNKPLPPSKIREVQLYNYDPDSLTAISNNKSSNGVVDEWYFFTPRDRKYKNGKRPGRAAGNGYWKATGADKNIKHEGNVVGSKKTLVFYKGKPPKGDKTNWIMHEFVLSNPPTRKRNGDGDMRLDDWVLCKLYKKQNAKLKPGSPQQGTEEEQKEAADANIPAQTETPIQEYHGIPDPQSEQFQANDFNVLPQQTFRIPSYNAYDDSTSAGLPEFPEYYNAYDAFAPGGLPQFPECHNAYGDSTSGGLPQFPECLNAYGDSASGGLPQFPECLNAYGDSASGGLPQFPECYNANGDSASGGLPQFPECYNAYGQFASGGLPQFPECNYYDLSPEPDSTIFPKQAVSRYGEFMPTVAPISSMPPAVISSMPPYQFPRMGHDNFNIHKQPQQQFPGIANNFQFSAADQFLFSADIGLPKY